MRHLLFIREDACLSVSADKGTLSNAPRVLYVLCLKRSSPPGCQYPPAYLGSESGAVLSLICASLLTIKLSIWNLAVLGASSRLGAAPKQSLGSWC